MGSTMSAVSGTHRRGEGGPGAASGEAHHGGAPQIFRASGPNRNAVVLDALRLVRDHRCAVKALAAKVFDHCEYSLVAEVLGLPAGRAALAEEWVVAFEHESRRVGVKERYDPAPSFHLGTHFLEATGPGEGVPVDVLDLISGEYNVPITVAYVRRRARGRGSEYTVQLVVDIHNPPRASMVTRSLQGWAEPDGRGARVIPLTERPNPAMPVLCGPRAPTPAPLATAAVPDHRTEMTPCTLASLPAFWDFAGGVDCV